MMTGRGNDLQDPHVEMQTLWPYVDPEKAGGVPVPQMQVPEVAGTEVTPTCPECGGVIELVTDAFVGRTMAPPFYVPGRRLEVRLFPVAIGACTECEFCIEIDIPKERS